MLSKVNHVNRLQKLNRALGAFEAPEGDRFRRRPKRRLSWLMVTVFTAITQGLLGCTAQESNFSCSPPSQPPALCVDVSAASPAFLNVPIFIVITIQSSSDVKGVSVSADMVPMNSRLGSFDKEPFWVVDLKGGEPQRLTFSTEIYEPGYYNVVALASVPDYDPLGDTLSLAAAVPTPIP